MLNRFVEVTLQNPNECSYYPKAFFGVLDIDISAMNVLKFNSRVTILQSIYSMEFR